jgi:hypothetical protein
MIRRVVACLSVVCACQHAPPPARPITSSRPAPAGAAKPEIKYVDDCNARFTDDPDRHEPDRMVARRLAEEADAYVASVNKMDEPSTRAELLVDAVTRYTAALKQDNFSAAATFGLAVAYDRLYRKGCALLMLKRLSQLEQYPPSRREARQYLDQVDLHFSGYRQDALAAAGR